MTTPFLPELTTTFSSLAEVIYSGQSYESIYETLCHSAVELIDGCDHASIMLRRHGRHVTGAASDEVARAIDELEKALDQGPCIDVLDEDMLDQHLCPDLTLSSPWPDLAARILAGTKVKGMGGFRIRQDGQNVGALNIFSDNANALTQRSLDQAVMLTAFASVAFAALDRGEEASTLRRGLQSNREIGKAIGLMMATHNIDDEQAFQMLSQVSQEMNIKLAQVANQVIAHHRK